jgi:hypothetical protein
MMIFNVDRERYAPLIRNKIKAHTDAIRARYLAQATEPDDPAPSEVDWYNAAQAFVAWKFRCLGSVAGDTVSLSAAPAGDRVKVYLAGGVAERLAKGFPVEGYLPANGNGDILAACDLICRLNTRTPCESEARQTALYVDSINATEKLLRENWGHVAGIAFALFHVNRLTAEQVELLQ